MTEDNEEYDDDEYEFKGMTVEAGEDNENIIDIIN